MKKLIYNLEADSDELELYVGNKETHLLRYFEPEPGIFIAESHNVIEIALRQGFEPLSVVTIESMLEDSVLDSIEAMDVTVPIYIVDKAKAQERFGYMLPGGILCAMRRKKKASLEEVLEGAKRIVVLEDVENPTNVGAIFRTAAALGVDAIILSPACVDPLYRRAMRVSVGNACLIPWTYVCRSEAEWQERGVEILKSHGFTTVAMALREDNIDVDDASIKKKKKLAFFMGNEGFGLSSSTIAACDYVAKIPMMNGVDSLNVAVAAGIAVWELTK